MEIDFGLPLVERRGVERGRDRDREKEKGLKLGDALARGFLSAWLSVVVPHASLGVPSKLRGGCPEYLPPSPHLCTHPCLFGCQVNRHQGPVPSFLDVMLCKLAK